MSEIEAIYTLLKVCYSGLPGTSGVSEIKGFFVNEKAVALTSLRVSVKVVESE